MSTDEVCVEATDLVLFRCDAGCHGWIVPHLPCSGLGLPLQTGYIGRRPAADSSYQHPISPERLPLMPAETLEFLLLLSGWVVAFLLGRELQTGFRLWRLRAAEQRARSRTD